jgi:hypothetical protein
MHRPGMLSIWFFIGMLLLAYGILILGSGIYEYMYPPQHLLVLAELHAAIWWGALLIILGAIYTFKFAPGKGK